jgi:hypothetical protein
VAWLLLIAALGVIALNPGMPSLGYAIFWLGVVAVARGISMLVTWVAIAVDLSLLLVCFFGMEIGGLILVLSIIGFAVADALDREPAPTGNPSARQVLERRIPDRALGELELSLTASPSPRILVMIGGVEPWPASSTP